MRISVVSAAFTLVTALGLMADPGPGQVFKWQGAYGAVSVSPQHVPQVSDYIARQKEHHADGSLVPEWEQPPDDQSAARVPTNGRSDTRVPSS